MIDVIATLLGEPKAEFLKAGHAPTFIRPTFHVRAVIEDDGRLFVPADFPRKAFYADPRSVLNVEIEE